GKIYTGKTETTFRTIGEFKSIEEIKNTVVNFYAGEVSVKVANLAEVNDSAEDESTRSFLNGKQTIFLNVHKQSGSNTVEVVEGLKTQIPTINQSLTSKSGEIE